MKRLIQATLLLLAVVLILSACQPTPKSSAVINKNEGVLESKINQEASDAQSFNIPEKISEEIYKTAKYCININAGVEKLTLEGYPVYSIAPDDFTQNEVDTAIKYFFKGSPLYARDYKKSKSMIKDEIVQLKAELQKIDPNDPDDIEGAKEAIQKLQNEYTSAPDTVEKTQITSKLTVPSDVNYSMLNVCADLGYPELSTISISNKPIFQLMVFIIDKSRWYGSTSLKLGEKAEGQKMTLEEAKQKAIDTINGLGIKNMIPEKAEIGLTEDAKKQGYLITFRQNVNNIPVVQNLIVNYTSNDMAAKWSSDSIKICVDDQGISYLSWGSKGKIEKEMTKNVEMLTFDKIMDTARQQLKNKFAWIDTNKLDYYQILTVRSIKLEYSCAQQKDNTGHYLLIPAWNFYGGITNKLSDGRTEEQFGSDICVLSLNAVDGSVIG